MNAPGVAALPRQLRPRGLSPASRATQHVPWKRVPLEHVAVLVSSPVQVRCCLLRCVRPSARHSALQPALPGARLSSRRPSTSLVSRRRVTSAYLWNELRLALTARVSVTFCAGREDSAVEGASPLWARARRHLQVPRPRRLRVLPPVPSVCLATVKDALGNASELSLNALDVVAFPSPVSL